MEVTEKIYLYGSGTYGINWAKKLGSERIKAFIDSSPKHPEEKEGIKVISINEIDQNTEIFVTADYLNKIQIIQNLVNKGLGSRITNKLYGDTVNVCLNSLVDPDTNFEGYNFVANESRIIRCSIGHDTYINFNSILTDCKIGCFSSIGPELRIVIGEHPTSKFVSTHPAFFDPENKTIGRAFVDKVKYEAKSYTAGGYSVEIGNDVWIGQSVKIKEGVCIGDGAVIATGATVIDNVAPYAVVGGVPAKIIRYRFSENQINYLLKLQWWNKPISWIEAHAEMFEDIDKFIGLESI